MKFWFAPCYLECSLRVLTNFSIVARVSVSAGSKSFCRNCRSLFDFRKISLCILSASHGLLFSGTLSNFILWFIRRLLKKNVFLGQILAQMIGFSVNLLGSRSQLWNVNLLCGLLSYYFFSCSKRRLVRVLRLMQISVSAANSFCRNGT